jgi:hypothetical protein
MPDQLGLATILALDLMVGRSIQIILAISVNGHNLAGCTRPTTENNSTV